MVGTCEYFNHEGYQEHNGKKNSNNMVQPCYKESHVPLRSLLFLKNILIKVLYVFQKKIEIIYILILSC